MTPKSMQDEFRTSYPGYSERVTRRVTALLYSDWEAVAFDGHYELSFGEFLRSAHGYVTAVINLAVSLEELGR